MTLPRRALVLSGGPHPFAETTPIVVRLLVDAGYEVTVADSPDSAATLLAEDPPDLWVCNTLRFRMLAPKYDELREEFAYETTEAVREVFNRYVREGGRLLALHAAPICFDDWSGWGDLLGARWDWENSWHPPLGEIDVTVRAGHTLTEGLTDFRIHDEAYMDMALAVDLDPLAVSHYDGVDHPLLWVRDVGKGTVVTSTLGHGRESFEHPSHQRLIRQAIDVLERDAS